MLLSFIWFRFVASALPVGVISASSTSIHHHTYTCFVALIFVPFFVHSSIIFTLILIIHISGCAFFSFAIIHFIFVYFHSNTQMHTHFSSPSRADHQQQMFQKSVPVNFSNFKSKNFSRPFRFFSGFLLPLDHVQFWTTQMLHILCFRLLSNQFSFICFSTIWASALENAGRPAHKR